MTMGTDKTSDLRDRFAEIALAQQSDKLHPRWATKDHLKQMSVYCYAIADAMMAARETPAEEKPSKPKVLNVNSTVRVKLTDYGRAVNARDLYISPKEDAEERSEWKLWQLMQAFGPHMCLGGAPCFEADIEVVE